MRFAIFATLALTFVLAGCGHDTLDSRNVQANGGLMYRSGEDKPYNGYITNIPEGNIYRMETGLNAALDNSLRQSNQQFISLQNGLFCDGYVRDGRLDGELVCKRDGKSYTRFNFEKGHATGAFQMYSFQLSSDHPTFAGTLAQGVPVGKLTQYAPDGSVLHTWDFNQ